MTSPNDDRETSEELTSLGASWWQRYSRHGEFPWSSAMALAFHAFLVVAILVLSVRLIQRDPTPPAVDVIAVVDDDQAAAGALDSPLTADSPLEAAAPVESAPQPEDMRLTELEHMKRPEEVKIETPTTDTGTQLQRAMEDVEAITKALEGAKERLKRNLASQSGGSGQPNAKTRGGRVARWILIFNFRNPADYMAQVEGLGASIAFPVSDERWQYFDHPSSDRTTSEVRPLSGEGRLYWITEDRNVATEVARHLGAAPAPCMVIFLPQELEDRMMRLEKAYQGLEEDEIRSTQYQCVLRGGKYDVTVVKQIAK